MKIKRSKIMRKIIFMISFTLLLFGCEESPTELQNEVAKIVEEKNQEENQKESVTAIKAVEIAEKSVVGISNVQMQQSGFSIGEIEAGSGSGVIYKKEGGKTYIATNNHVVEGADVIELTLWDGTRIEGKIIGADPFTDLAVLVTDSNNIPNPIELGRSKDLRKGQTVLAIGNPLGLNFAGSVSKGIISGTERIIPVDVDKNGTIDWETEVLQTDAAINPGNSGGALINLDGELVGINSMKIAKEQIEGLGFSIPIDSAVTILQQLEENGRIERPNLKISMLNLSDIPGEYKAMYFGLDKNDMEGVIVGKIIEENGFKELDVIKKVNGEKTSNIAELRKELYQYKKGKVIEMEVWRDGETRKIDIKL
jgi:serine protease Do